MMKSNLRRSKKMYRVRFKCEVQVIEYNQTSSDGEQEAAEEWDDNIMTCRTLNNNNKPPSTMKNTDERTSKIALRLGITAILVVALYKWWSVVMQT